MSQILPEEFLIRMKQQLGDEYEAYIASFDEGRRNALHVNTLKISPEKLKAIVPFETEPVSWLKDGFFFSYEAAPARLPFYRAGLYYIQEASAQTPVDRFPVLSSDRVLDLCAAPGGKSVQLLGKLKKEGFLVSNDYSAQRARALLRNLELTGADNYLVLNEDPANIAKAYPAFFDKVLVDAPCSGEGMFRKNAESAADWSKEKVKSLAETQKEILKSAVSCLKPGGLLMYSTCTFSPEEDEGAVSFLLDHYPELSIMEIPGYEGFSNGDPELGNGNPLIFRAVRLWPHKMPADGHFMALFRKADDEAYKEDEGRQKKERKKRKANEAGAYMDPEKKRLLETFLKETGISLSFDGLEVRGERLFKVRKESRAAFGLNFLRNGLYVGEFKKGRFEPSQPFALSLSPENCANTVKLLPDDERLSSFLRGENILLKEQEGGQGWTLVCVGDYPAGFGKTTGRLCKNRIPQSWRS